jgi:acyl carrier protein phosphodiesterase
MNFLAHILLARQSDEAMLGAWLGDFCKPGQEHAFSLETQREIRLHRKVDAFTDSHPVVREAKSRFGERTRRFAGIALDVFYDHVLALDWKRYCEEPLEHFNRNFYRMLISQREMLPANVQTVATYMVSQDWLGSYTEFDGVRIALQRISRRLSRNGERLVEGIEDLERNYAEFSTGFHAFFPALQDFVATERARMSADPAVAAGSTAPSPAKQIS